MSATDWKPGDVVAVRMNGNPGTAVRVASGVLRGGPDGPCWMLLTLDGKTKGDGGFVRDYPGANPRPLVVLDPESDEDSARLAEALYLAGMVGAGNADGEYRTGVADRVQAALRELANPTPKPDEPPGLGAVVEDNEGCLWFRMTVENQTWPGEVWQEQFGAADRWSKWDEIDVVRVLSEGVPE